MVVVVESVGGNRSYSVSTLTIGCGDPPHEIYDLVAYTRTRYAHESFDPGFPG